MGGAGINQGERGTDEGGIRMSVNILVSDDPH